MPKKALREQLSELHGELASAAQLDPELRAQLREVAREIEKVLEQQSAQNAPSSTELLQNRVQQATVDFEAEHPRLARILGDLADTLTKLGI
jgi:hypothetical protein